LNVALLPLTVPVPSVVDPSLNVTVPLDDPPKAGVMAAVKVTACPCVEGFSEEASFVVVLAFLTVSVSAGEVLVRRLVLPEYTAVMEWLPTVNVLTLRVATPLLFNVADPNPVVPFLKVTLPVGTPVVLHFTVAVSVTDCPYEDGFTEDATLVELAALFTF